MKIENTTNNIDSIPRSLSFNVNFTILFFIYTKATFSYPPTPTKQQHHQCRVEVLSRAAFTNI